MSVTTTWGGFICPAATHTTLAPAGRCPRHVGHTSAEPAPTQGVIIELPVCRGSGRGRRLEEGEKGQGEAGGSQGSGDPKDTVEGPVTTAWRELGEGRWTQGEQAAAAQVLQTWADSAAPCVRALMCVSTRACREDPTWGRFSDSVVEKWGHLGSGCSR